MIDEQKLRELAEAATPGPWAYYADDNIISSESQPTAIIALAYRSVHCPVEQRIANGTFAAAANPAAILALLDELQSLRSESAAWRVTAENAEKEISSLKSSLGEPVAEIIMSDDDFDMGLTDDYAFGRKTLTNGTHQLYALSNKETP